MTYLLMTVAGIAGYLGMSPLVNKYKRHTAANRFRESLELPTKTLLRRKRT